MARTVIIDSPAKINLHLDVFGKREDGFHELFSLFQLISLYDHISIEEAEAEGSCSISGPFDFPAEDNIMYKAVSLFRRKTGYSRGVKISIDKNIPQGGGLGGGSGNAASVLKAMQILSEVNLSVQELMEMGAALGSDVPFFLSSPAAVVTGRGEFLESLTPRTDFNILLAVPPFSINTGEAFNTLARYRETHRPEYPLTREEAVSMYSKMNVSDWRFHNSFLNCLKKVHNTLENIVNLFYDAKADFAGMSGSGSVMFGVFGRQEDCISASEKLSESFGEMIFVNPLDTASEAALQLS